MDEKIGGRTGLAVNSLLIGTRQRIPGISGGFAHGIKFRKLTDLRHQRHILAGPRIDAVDLSERELQPVGLLSHLTRTVGAVDEITPRDQPFIAQFAVALQGCRDTGEPVQCPALFVGAHQSQLIVLAVQGQQSGGEGGQGFRRHTAPAEVGPRRSVATDRTQRDDTAVVIAVGARGVQDLVDRRAGGAVEVLGAEPALHHRAR